ncbi:MAG TPA: tripartite tricarboxylate transporter substrate binding protein, partial [Beijerinckiaceae bacterium]
QKDFAPVSGMAEIPVAVIAHPSLPVNDMADLVALAKKSPESVTYGTAGPGTFPHLSVLMLEKLAGVKLLAVHYRGVAPALNDVTAGHVNMIVMGPSIAIPSYKAGKLKMLGIGSDQPLPQLPEVQPVSRTVAGYAASAGFGLAAPAATPRSVIVKINKDVQDVLADAEFQEKILAPQSLLPIKGDADAFAAQLRAESQKWEKIIADASFELK